MPKVVAWRIVNPSNRYFTYRWNEGSPSADTVEYWTKLDVDIEYAYAAPPDAELRRLHAENDQLKDLLFEVMEGLEEFMDDELILRARAAIKGDKP